MKRQSWLLSLLLLLALPLSGCGLIGGTEKEALKRLDASTWPTAAPPTAVASPTPFPQADLAPTATPTTPATAAAATKAPPAGQATASNTSVTSNQAQAAPVQGQTAPETAAPSTQAVLSAVTSGRITTTEVNLRQGPGANYAKLGTLASGQTVDALATNLSQDWVLVQSGRQTGWISLKYVDLSDSNKGLPVVRSATPDQVSAGDVIAPVVLETEGQSEAIRVGAPAVTETGSKSEAVVASASAATQQTQSVVSALSPVTTAKISVNKTEIRPGPDVTIAAIDDLTDPQEELTVYALDKSRQWALVQPQHSRLGWAAVADLQFGGSLDAAPTVYTAWVASNFVEVRSGPGIFHDQTGRLAINSLVRVLGLDDSGSWAMIQPIPGGSLGWSPIQFLKNVGQAWANVPPAPDMPATVQAVAATEPFTPARPVSESKIVFQRSSGGDIMVINPDGSGLRRLTGGIDPVLSPDGQTVAFTRWQGDSGSLWLIGVDGSSERQVLGFTKQAKGPDWSPDGKQIVLNFQHEGLVNPETECAEIKDGKQPNIPTGATDIKIKIEDGVPHLCWLPPADPHWGLRVVNVTDGSFEDVDGGTYAFRPAWDPVQSWRIVSDGGRGLLQVDLNRDNRRNLTDETNDGSPAFSPDGRYLAVSMGKEGSGSGYNLYRLNADGGGRVQLTQTPLWVTSQPDEAKAWNNVAPAWSPDASQIAFLTDRTGRWEIWLMNADGSNPHAMFSDAVNQQLQLIYNFVDERIFNWR